MNARELRIGILGAGTVGAQVIRILREDSIIAERIGHPVEITGVLVRDVHAPRQAHIPAELLTSDPDVIFPEDTSQRPDIVVELIGGIEPARTLIARALTQGSTVVTANKALLATHGSELYALADEHKVGLYYEAAVAGAIPILRALRESLAGDKVRKIQGIVNGTTNFILDAMTSNGQAYEEALTQAQELGYAEADPTADVEGHDAAAKCAILASLAFNAEVTLDDVPTRGISTITPADIDAARGDGCTVKLIATAEYLPATEDQEESIIVSVEPVALPSSHPLSGVKGAYNAVYVTCENAGELMFYGPGAGGSPTASAVCGDIVQAARTLVQKGALPLQPQARRLAINNR